MLAAWYERAGPASEVLQVGNMPDPEPSDGEVRIRLTRSGVNPGDVKKRGDWVSLGMPYPRIIPHSDGAGVIDKLGSGVDDRHVGQRVWIYGAQSYRPFGTAAQLTTVPADQAAPLPDEVSDDVGACLGIPGITAHRAVFADGPVTGQTVLVQGILGAVGTIAAQLATWGGATVIGTAVRNRDLERAPVDHPVVALDDPTAAERIRDHAPNGVNRIIEVAFSENIDLDAGVAAPNAIIAAYATRETRPSLPFWPTLFANLTIRLFGSDDFPAAAKHHAATDLSIAAQQGSVTLAIAEPIPLERIAEAHDRASTPAAASESSSPSPADAASLPAPAAPSGLREARRWFAQADR